jgi:Putative bacterial sensory transduction regulator
MKTAALILFSFVSLSFGANIEKITKNELEKTLKEEGYAATSLPDSKYVIKWKIEGVETFLVVDPKGDCIQFYVTCGNKMPAEKANAWNQDMKYSRTYINSDGDPSLCLDLDLAGGISRERLLDFLNTCKLSLKVWREDCLE